MKKTHDHDGDYIVGIVKEVYDDANLPIEVCFDIIEIDHTIEGTNSQKETIDFYKLKILKNDRD